ncbi:MAG: polyribonucleotide nucleotidyltransferase, partial [Firmicutes bacterium]|nr:polyribonucleotide nucleotidyltransferase [Bacillota bacterium]
MTNILRKSLEIAGRTLTLETGRMAKQASGAVFVSYGDTMVLSCATMSETAREGIDFFPLQVEFEEKMYSVGKIPGGFIKREGRPSEKAILCSRLIDRPLRPLFPKGFHNDVQVINTVLSVDQDCQPDMAAMIGASAAVHISKIPFNGPIAGVTIGLIGDEYVLNPTQEEAEQSEMHLSVAGTADAVMMVEAGANEIPENVILEGIMFAHEEIKRIVAFIEEFRAEALAMGLAQEKIPFEKPTPDPELEAAVRASAGEAFREAMKRCSEERIAKEPREAMFAEINQRVQDELAEAFPEQQAVIGDILYTIEKETMRSLIAKDKIRIDGRKTTEVRPISCEVGVLARTHGSALFTRGQTQILNALTLGMVSQEQILDGIAPETSKRYMHHYNFPPYSVGEARPVRSPGRREIGHGALAERALLPVIPDEDQFPYSLRLVSEAIESNGSTSMGSVCASTLALMDAGVPISAPVSGCAMGLIKEGD